MAPLLATFQAWASSHVLLLALLWPAFSFCVTWAFAKHSDEDYARLPSWLAHALRFTGSLGVNGPALLLAIGKLLAPTQPPAGGGSGPYRTPVPMPKDDTEVPPMASKGVSTGTIETAWDAFTAFFWGTWQRAALLGIALGILPHVFGCAWLKSPQGEQTALTIAQGACVVAQVELGAVDPATVAASCNIPSDEVPLVEIAILAHQSGMAQSRATVSRTRCKIGTSSCSDAGAEAGSP